MNVEMIAVGTELLLGQIVNGNAADIGGRLALAGIDHFHQVVVGDNLARAADAITQAVGRADAVIITGGLGPTQDDLTREAMCVAAGVEMALSDEAVAHLRAWWAHRGRDMPESNLRQAEYPQGASFIANPKGTAPGLRMRIGNAWVIALPGVPQEMLPMLEDEVVPFLKEQAGGGTGVLVSRVLRVWGEGESRVAEALGDLFHASVNPTVAFLASGGEVKVRLTARAGSSDEAWTLLGPLESEVRSRLGKLVFAVDGEIIGDLVLAACRRRGWSLGTAESATGGLVSAEITSVPGASDVFVGAVVAYSPATKARLLGVPPALMEEQGVVSEATALAMAEGGAGHLGADVVVAVTGSAGPSDGGAPVGTMIVAVRTPEGSRARTFRMPGDRERARTYTATAALHCVRLALSGEWW
jgi:nicotinamide-nucleotide amidase